MAEIPSTVQNAMSESLGRALERISSLETPSPAPPAPVVAYESQGSDIQAGAEVVDDTQSEGGGQTPNLSTPPVEPAWGPQQHQALHQILQANTAMEGELKTLRDKAAQYEGMISDAKLGDVGSFADKAQIDRNQLLEALKNEGSTPATLPYVRKLEAKLAALEQQWEQRAATDTQQRELSEIATQLNNSKNYGILKQIPDAAARIQALRRQREAEAKSRGEIAQALSVDQAASLLKSDVVNTLKRFLSDDDVRKELGLGESVTPDTVKSPRPKKAITSSMTSQGSTHKTTTGYDPEERLLLALRKVKNGA